MSRIAIVVGAAVSVVMTAAPLAEAANLTLVRSSRPVSSLEAGGGAPAGGMVHDFYATSDVDLLTVVPTIDVPVYRHPYVDDRSLPAPELVAAFPAIGANSFLQLPGSTLVLGGRLNALGTETAWGDLDNSGPQTDFLFGRLTTSQAGTFNGRFFLRGNYTYIEVPFSFTLPGSSGPLHEQLSVSGMESPLPEYAPPSSAQRPPVEELPYVQVEPWPVVETQTLPLGGPVPDWAKVKPGRPLTKFVKSAKGWAPWGSRVSAMAVPEPAGWIIVMCGLPWVGRRAG